MKLQPDGQDCRDSWDIVSVVLMVDVNAIHTESFQLLQVNSHERQE